MQNILDSASASLTTLVSQGLRQRAVLPLALFGPEGNFGSGSQIVQAVARILGTALPLPQAALAPAPPAIYSLPPAQIVTAAGEGLCSWWQHCHASTACGYFFRVTAHSLGP